MKHICGHCNTEMVSDVGTIAGWECPNCGHRYANSGESRPPLNPIINQVIMAGWDRICEGVREAGKNMIEEPDKVVNLLRGLADSIEKRKGSFNGGKSERTGSEDGQ